MAEHVVFTADADAATQALADLKRADPSARFERWLDKGIGLAMLDSVPMAGMGAALLAARAPFIRHLAPVVLRLKVRQTDEDLDDVAAAVLRLQAGLDPRGSFSVQTRFVGQTRQRMDPVALTREVSGLLSHEGFTLNIRQPEQIVSIVCAEDTAYAGISLAAHNLSDWAGGARRYKQDQDTISRAEFKLLEACEVFGVALPASGQALDLGAAPGGWTRLLRQAGLRVIAVDPADLDARLRGDGGIQHMRQLAQRYLAACDQRFDVLVNDLRMDALQSVELMVQAAQFLSPDGLAIMTLKLPEHGANKALQRVFGLLETAYHLVGLRQLYHNRSEVTAAMRLRSN
jgi:23S rRNA (cytidine2498-2'-O)-methyltransferase